METSVLGPAALQDLTSRVPQDSVSQDLGNQDGFSFCGERQFRITSLGHDNYLSYNDVIKTLTLLSVDENEVGSNIEVTIEAYLVDYQNIVGAETFFVSIRTCELTAVIATITPD